MATDYKLISCILPLVFGHDLGTGSELTSTAVDVPSFAGQDEFAGCGFVMPVDGSIVAISGTRETGHDTITQTGKVNINGTASSVAVCAFALGTGVLECYATFNQQLVTLKAGDIIGFEELTNDVTGFAPNNVCFVVFIQLGHSTT